MKIPESVRIAGIEYPVKFVENLRHGSQICYGRVDFENCLIMISDTDGKDYQHQCVSLWHEIVHTLLDNAEFEVPEDKEEVLVTILARGIYQVLQDNGGRLFDLAPEQTSKTKSVMDIEQDLIVERAQSEQYKKQLEAAKTLLHTTNELCAGVAVNRNSDTEEIRNTLLVCKLIDDYFDEGEKNE